MAAESTLWLLLVIAVSASAEPFVVSKNGVVGKAAIMTGPAHIGVPAACFSRVDPGPCGNDIVRIYYDYKTYTCKAFSYSGCGGNMNRFVSVKNCYKLCHPYYRQRPADMVEAANGTSSNATTTMSSAGEPMSAEPTATPAITWPTVTGTFRNINEKTTTPNSATSPASNSTTAVPEIEFIHHIFENEETGYVGDSSQMGVVPMAMMKRLMSRNSGQMRQRQFLPPGSNVYPSGGGGSGGFGGQSYDTMPYSGYGRKQSRFGQPLERSNDGYSDQRPMAMVPVESYGTVPVVSRIPVMRKGYMAVPIDSLRDYN